MSVSRSESRIITEVTPSSENRNERLDNEQPALKETDVISLQKQDGTNDGNQNSDIRDIVPLEVHPESRPITTSVSFHSSSTQQTELRDRDFGYVDRFSPWFPKIDPQYHQAKGLRSWRIWHSKRQIILWTAFVSSTVVLLVNVILVAVLGSKHGISSTKGLIKLYEGDCDRVKLIGTGSHVGINILSTLLLGASNLCMQLLVAPTRQEVDVAHRRKIWLDIGIPSWRNLANIKPSRRYLVFLLMLSSVPLHFM